MGLAGAAAAAAISAVGSIQEGNAQASASNYSAAVARNNAIIADQNATYTELSGQQKAQIAGLQGGQQVGLIRATQGANGIDVNSGSAVAAQAGQREAVNLNQQNIVDNALLQAYGYKSQATGFTAQAGLDTAAADEAPIAAAFTASSGLLKGASQAASL